MIPDRVDRLMDQLRFQMPSGSSKPIGLLSATDEAGGDYHVTAPSYA